MTDIDAFLAANTFYCAPLHARISRTQCGTMINTGDLGSCATCPEAEHADMRGAVSAGPWWAPRRAGKKAVTPEPAKEEIVETVCKEDLFAELARETGIPVTSLYTYVSHIRRHPERLPGKALEVKAAMDRLGLELAAKGLRRKGETDHAPVALEASPAGLEIPVFETQGDFLEHVEEELEAEDAVMGGTVARPAPVCVPVTASSGDAVDITLISLELMLAEVKRRLPAGACVTISL